MTNKYAIGFPPRESFTHGLCIDFYNNYEDIRKVFHDVSNYLGLDLYQASFNRGCFKENLQMVCLLVYCNCIYNLIQKEIDTPKKLFGYSQGEFSAILASNSLSIFNASELVFRLENIILEHRNTMEGMMIRVIGLSHKRLEKICSSIDPTRKKVSIGINISDQQNIISGNIDAVRKVADIAKEEGANFTIKVSDVAFHSASCQEVQLKSQEVFSQYDFIDTKDILFSCYSGTTIQDRLQIKKSISNQIANTIQWNMLCRNIVESGVDYIIEVGPGCIVSGNMRLLYPMINYKWVSTIKDLEIILDQLRTH